MNPLDHPTDPAVVQARCAALKREGWRMIANDHRRYVETARVPCQHVLTRTASNRIELRPWCPEWAAMLLQISCVVEQRTPAHEILGAGPRLPVNISYILATGMPRDREPILDALLFWANTDPALQQRLLGLSAWADLETDDDTYYAGAFQFWNQLHAEVLRRGPL